MREWHACMYAPMYLALKLSLIYTVRREMVEMDNDDCALTTYLPYSAYDGLRVLNWTACHLFK